jgi:tetratricopeptide (TPR) repeat protein
MAMGRKEEAIRCFDEIIKSHPVYFPAWYNKGVALRQLKRTEEALEHFEEAIRLLLDKKPDLVKGRCLNNL